MSLIGQYKEPRDLLLKMLREGKHVYQLSNGDDIADSFFNFCVTSHSLRDWVIKYLTLTGRKINDFHDECNKNTYLVICRDVANSSKHGGVDSDRARPTISAVDVGFSEIVPIYPDGIPRYDLIQSKKMISIKMADGQEVMILTFIFFTARAWFDIFDMNMIPRDGTEELLSSIPVKFQDRF